MINEALRDSSSGDWQQIALIFFVLFFAAAVRSTFRRGSKDELEPYKYLPLQDDNIDVQQEVN